MTNIIISVKLTNISRERYQKGYLILVNEPIHIYVAANGSDSAAGTRNAPLATLDGAKKRLESIGTPNGATVTILEGVYSLNDSIVFGSANSGTASAPIVFEAEGNVIFSGGVTVSADKIGSVTDAAMARRIPDASRVRAVDLSGLGFDSETCFGAEESQPRFFAGNKSYENARFPNREKTVGVNKPYIYSKRIIADETEEGGCRVNFYYDDKAMREHMARWSAEAYDDMYIYGYFWHQWVYNTYRGEHGSADYGALTASAKYRAYDAIGDTEGNHRRQFISNLPEELDAEGEYYYDKKSSVLYFIPNDDITAATPVTVSVLNVPALVLENAENIIFKGIKFHYFRSTPISVSNSNGIVFENCEIAHTSKAAATVFKSVNCRFDSCDIFDTASGGIYFDGCGNRYELAGSGNAVENCIIHDINRVLTCYRPAVHFKNGCGFTIKGCTLSDAPHALIILEHINDITIEDNRIINACLDTDDCSAIYWGRDPSDIGIVIRHNFFANIGHKEADYSIAAIYVDDWATCCEVYNNIFYNCGLLSDENMTEYTSAKSIVLNNAQFLNAYNNIFIGTYQDQKPTNLSPAPSIVRWINLVNGIEPAHQSPSEVSWYETLEDTGFFTEKWRFHYKNTHWAGMWDYVNADIQKKIADYRAAHADDSSQKQYIDMSWSVFDNAWDHTTEDGKKYNGTLYQYVKEAYSEQLKKELEDYEGNPPTEGNINEHLVWQAIIHKLRFRTTNVFINNVAIGMDRAYLTEDEHLKGHTMNGFYQNYVPETDKLADGSSMFIKYGENFELTPEGIAEIHKHLPEFHNISMDGIGAVR